MARRVEWPKGKGIVERTIKNLEYMDSSCPQ